MDFDFDGLVNGLRRGTPMSFVTPPDSSEPRNYVLGSEPLEQASITIISHFDPAARQTPSQTGGYWRILADKHLVRRFRDQNS